MMRVKHLYSFFFLASLLLCLLSSCRVESENKIVLQQADSLMPIRPDSALILLSSIKDPECMSRNERAAYAVLLTQAKHKNYVKLLDDSLIQTAVDYYAGRDDKEWLAKAYYYAGCVQEDMGDIVAAVADYLNALEVKLEGEKEYELLTMMYESLGRCYREQGFYDKAMEVFRASYQVNQRLNEKEKIIYPLKNISSVYLHQAQWDSAAYYCNEILDVARTIGDSTWVSIVFNNLAHIYLNQKNYTKARLCVLKSMKEGSNNGEVADNYILLGRTLTGLGQLDSARYYLSLGKSVDDDIYTQAICASMLYDVDKTLGNYKEAIEHNETYLILFDSIQDFERRQEVGKLIDNYALENKKRELSRKHEDFVRLSLCGFLALIVVLISTYFIVDRYRNKKCLDLQKSLVQNRGEVMRLYRELERTDKTTPLAEDESLETELEDLDILRARNFALSLKQYQETVYYERIHALMYKSRIEEKIFTVVERDELHELIFRFFAETMADLKKQCLELTREDQLYCIFYILGYSNPIIYACTGTNVNALKTRKGRLKAKMSGKLYSFVFSTPK